MELSLTAVILNWNAAPDTIRCVQRVASWQAVQSTIVVVDNASADGSARVIARECPHIHLFRNPVNLGFGGGNNRGIKEALRLGDAPILLLNNDALIEEDDVIKLLDTLHACERIGLIGPLLYDAEDKDQLLAAGSKDPSRHHHSHIQTLSSSERVQIVECVPGTAIIVRPEVFHNVGLLDERYFFASEVVDLCLRAAQQGYLSAIDTESRAYHDLKRSSEIRRTLHSYYIVRNRFLLIRKFHRASRPFYYILWTLYTLTLSLKTRLRGQRDAARAIRLGLTDGLRGRFGGQNQRVLTVTSTTNRGHCNPWRLFRL